MKGLVIVTTVGNEEQANLIAREIVARRLAACVNVVPGVRSVYRWKGCICTDSEHLLVIKSAESEFDAVAQTIRELHNYELPEILSFAVRKGSEPFLAWIQASIDKNAPFDDDEDLAVGEEGYD